LISPIFYLLSYLLSSNDINFHRKYWQSFTDTECFLWIGTGSDSTGAILIKRTNHKCQLKTDQIYLLTKRQIQSAIPNSCFSAIDVFVKNNCYWSDVLVQLIKKCRVNLPTRFVLFYLKFKHNEMNKKCKTGKMELKIEYEKRRNSK
jgi:hypothetical protein